MAGLEGVEVDPSMENVVWMNDFKNEFEKAVKMLWPDHPLRKTADGDVNAIESGRIKFVPIKGSTGAVFGRALGDGYIGIDVSNIRRYASEKVDKYDYPASNPGMNADQIALILGGGSVGHETTHDDDEQTKWGGLHPQTPEQSLQTELNAHGVGRSSTRIWA